MSISNAICFKPVDSSSMQEDTQCPICLEGRDLSKNDLMYAHEKHFSDVAGVTHHIHKTCLLDIIHSSCAHNTPLFCAYCKQDIVHITDLSKEDFATQTQEESLARRTMNLVKRLGWGVYTKEDKEDPTKKITAWAEQHGLCIENLVYPVSAAASRGDLPLLRSILSQEISTSDRGKAVIAASKQGHPECIKELLADNAAISQEDRGLAVQSASNNGHLECIKELLAGHHPIERPVLLASILHATWRKHPDCVKELTPSGDISLSKEELKIVSAVATFRKRLDYVKELTQVTEFRNRTMVVSAASVALISGIFYQYYWNTQAAVD